MATVTAQLNRLRISPTKVRMVVDVIRGLPVRDALQQLDVMDKAAALPVAKLVRSCIANAEHNLGYTADNLAVAEIHVGGGMMIKRWMPRAQGRANRILKRTAHIALTLAEIEDGKHRVTPRAQSIVTAATEAKKVSVHDDAHTHGAPTAVPTAQKMSMTNKAQRMFRRKSA